MIVSLPPSAGRASGHSTEDTHIGYLHISNLFKERDILLFRRCFAMEKIHGTSAHLKFKRTYGTASDEGTAKIDTHLTYFSGGENHTNFVALFNEEALKTAFQAMGVEEVTIYGEAYGGKCQGMRETYGDKLRFIVFDVQVGDCWLNVSKAEKVALDFGLDFVFYEEIDTEIAALDAARDRDSTQAIRNGCGPGKKAEGVVLRPLIELTKNNGDRIIIKHKRDDFSERKSNPKVTDAAKLAVLASAQAVSEEFVTDMRLTHVLDKIPAERQVLENMKGIIDAMVEDVLREGAGEFTDTKEVRASIGVATAKLFKKRLQESLRASSNPTATVQTARASTREGMPWDAPGMTPPCGLIKESSISSGSGASLGGGLND